MIPKHQSFGEKYIVIIIKSSAIMCINVYAIFKGNIMRVKCKILFSPFIDHHIYAIGMSHVRQEVGGKGHVQLHLHSVVSILFLSSISKLTIHNTQLLGKVYECVSVTFTLFF